MTTETKEQPEQQHWTHPKLSAAGAALHRATQRHSTADTILKRRREDREIQERLEAEIRARGLEPIPFDPLMPAIDQSRYQGQLVRTHVTDESLEIAERHYRETKADLEAAEEVLEKARKLKPITQKAIRAKAAETGAQYQVIKPMHLYDVDYWPGDLLPVKVADRAGYMKVDQWQRGPVPSIRRID